MEEEKKDMDTEQDVSEAEDKESGHKVDLDAILKEELGEFGFYQIRTLLLLVLPVFFISFSSTEYIFSTARIQTRCLIPECESSQIEPVLLPDWLLNAVPTVGENDAFDNCQRFRNISSAVVVGNEVCPAQLFDRETVVACEEYVYANTNTIVYDFGLACDEWRRTLIGSLRTAGVLLSLPMAGFISDKWGRRTALTILAINTAWIGALRYFASTYVGFIISQVAESTFGAGGYSCTYILSMEIVGRKYRVAASAYMSTIFAFGQMATGLVAWAVPNWRLFTLTLYLPQFLAISFFWILPESVRWYLSKNKFEEAEAVLKNIARINKKQLSERSLQALRKNAEEETKKQKLAGLESADEPWLIVLVFRYKPILLRCLVSPVWWITLTFIYYGLTINSVNISGNSYVNFIIVTAVEIPGFWIGFLLMDTVGRKASLIAAYWICSACQFAYLFLSNDLYAVSLTVYLIGKLAIAAAATTLYVYTSELYPTRYRHRLFAFSSMMGRVGAIIAPLTPAFGESLPFILFGSFALVAGLLVLLTPETRGARFPDTMEEAVATGHTS